VRLVDVLVSAAILAVALWLLVRSVRRAGAGGCHGCTSGGCGTRRGSGVAPLVSIGSPRRPADGGDHPTAAGSGYIASSSER
jgi:hypothetical protein